MELHDDDQPIGRILTRREALAILGGAGVSLLVGGSFGFKQLAQAADPTATPTLAPATTCVVRPALTEGPYFVDTMLNRSDIRADVDGTLKEGALLHLIFRVSDVSNNACSPLANAQVDVWHCDALGVYSGVSDPGFDTSNQTWLRGYQLTNANGMAEFITIYPGWYSGRAVHIHFKIRTDPDSEQGYEFTSQFFFDEALTDVVHTQEPYASKGQRDLLNENDGIYQQSEGALLLELVEEGEGYKAVFDIALDMTQTEAGGGNPPPGNGGGNRPPGGTPPARPGG